MTEPIDKGLYRVLHLVGKGLSAVSDLLFSSSDKAAAHRLSDSLAEDILRSWSYLLDRHRGELQQEARIRTSFDFASCDVRFPLLWVRVVRGRGEIRVQVAAPGPDGRWEELGSVLHALPGADLPNPQDGLAAHGIALQTHWDTILEAVQQGNGSV